MSFLRRFVLFGIVGAVGFVVDTAVLYALRGLAGLYVGRVFSFLTAAFATWVLNRSLTFRDRRSGTSRRSEFGIYLTLMLAGGAVNYAAYAAMILRYEQVGAHPVIGVAIGSLAGMIINLLSSRFLLFRFADPRTQKVDEAGRKRENPSDVAQRSQGTGFTMGHKGKP